MNEVVHMAAMGAVTSVLAPTVVLATRNRWSWRPLSLPPPVALVGFVLLHAAVVLDDHDAIDLRGITEHTALMIGAIAFWLPVLAGPRRLDPGGRAIYLFIAGPSLDLAGAATVARGNPAGLAMIVAMMPLGVTAVVLAWRWFTGEERAARAAEALGEPPTAWVPAAAPAGWGEGRRTG